MVAPASAVPEALVVVLFELLTGLVTDAMETAGASVSLLLVRVAAAEVFPAASVAVTL